MEEEIELREIFKIFWDKKLEIILILILSVILGVFYTKYLINPEYTSSATIILANDDEGSQNKTLTQSEVTLNDKLITTYSTLAKSNSVLEEVIENLRIKNRYDENSLRNKVTVAAITNTQVIKISATDENPRLASEIANEITKVFTKKVSQMYNINNIKVLSSAETSTTPSNIDLKKNVIIFLAGGLAIGIIYCIIANLLDTTIKDKQNIEEITSSNVLAEIPIYDFKRGKENKKEIITHIDAKSPISEIFRALRTNLQFMYKGKETQTILITSTIQSEGKSWIAANLATTFAQAGMRTLLIDADMRRARQHKIFEINNIPGLSNYLSNIGRDGERKELKTVDCIVKTEIANLYILPSGNTPPNPSELLVSKKTEDLIKEVSENFEVVIFDGAPCLMVTDSCIISRLVSQTLLVTNYKSTKKDDLREVKKRIDNVNGHVVGVVLNKVKISAKKYNSKYYYYSENSSRKNKEENVNLQKQENINIKENVEGKEVKEEKEDINIIDTLKPVDLTSDRVKEIVNDIENYKED